MITATPLSTPGLHADPGTARLLAHVVEAYLADNSPQDVANDVLEGNVYDAGTFAPHVLDAIGRGEEVV
jgi:hypothetical protein